MADRPFTIRKMPPGERTRPRPPEPPIPTPPTEQSRPAPPPAPAPPPPAAPEPPPDGEIFTATAGRFTNPSASLALLSSVAGARLSEEAVVRRSRRNEWWVELPVPLETAAPMVSTAGGEPFGFVKGIWVPVGGDGSVLRKGKRQSGAAWESVGLVELLAAARLQPGQYRGATALHVIVPGSLGRWVLRRVSMLSLSVTVTAVRRLPFVGASPQSGALLFRIQSQRGTIATSLVRSLCNLPYVIVAPPSGLEPDTLLVDVRHRPPFPIAVLGAMMPEGEIWVLGPPDVGHCRLTLVGDEIDGATLLDAPATTVADVPAMPPESLPDRLPVRLAPHAHRAQVDAVLLDDAELGWLVQFLIGHPVAESSFVIPGDGVHLFVAPGGLPPNVPFGTPMTRAGEAGLFIELGRAFQPPLPNGAQRAAFGLNEESIVAVTDRGAWRFRIDRLVPAWSLWIGAAPDVRDGLSEEAARALRSLPAEVRRVADLDGIGFAFPLRRGPRRSSTTDAPTLLMQATQLELAGNFVAAAELLERAGEPGRAARLYERSARRGR